MLVVEAQRLIRASAEHVFNHLAPAEHLARYAAPLWMVSEPGDKHGAAQMVELRGFFIGLPIESVQRLTLHPPASLEFVQVRGTLRAFSGRCTVRSTEDGTEVVYRLEVDPGIPMLTEGAARQFLSQYLGRMLDRVKLAAERKAPVRRVTRAAATSTAVSEPAGIDDEEPVEPAEPPVEELPAAAPEPAAVPPGRSPAPGHRPASGRRQSPPTRQGAAATASGVLGSAAADSPQAETPRDGAAAEASQSRKRRRRRRRRRPGSGPQPPPGQSP